MDWEAFYNMFRKPDFVPGYEIQNRLGGGAFGEVYKARKASIGKAYAIKFLKIDDDAQREAVERELEQVRHFAAIDHPNLVTIEDLGTVMDVPYLIMGYAGEDTLSRRLREGKLGREEAMLYFVQVCRGVLALHDRRLVHFDLKPSNVFLKGEIARVGDYGLSKMMSDGRLTLSFGRGTPQYMAPEMLRSRADHRADIYSLGVILYECLTGRLPFESAVPGTVVVRESDAPPAFPPDFPAPLRKTVERCLRVSPDDRFASLTELLVDLGQTARPGDSVRLDLAGGAAKHHVPSRAGSAPTPHEDPASPARQTAANLARGAVEVARGVWDGLKTASTKPRPPSGPPYGPRAGTPLTRPPGDAGGPSARAPSGPSPSPAAEPPTPGPAAVLTAAPAPSPKAAVETLAMQTLTSPRPAPVTHAAPAPTTSISTAAGAAGAGTIPVPPRVEGGWWRTLGATLALGVEVMLSMVQWLLRRVPQGFGRTSSRILHGVRGLVVRVVRLILFVLVLAGLGAGVTWLLITVLSR